MYPIAMQIRTPVCHAVPAALKGEKMNRNRSAARLTGTETRSSGLALPFPEWMLSMSLPTSTFPMTTKITEMTGSHVKKADAHVLTCSTSDMYLLK